MTSNVVLVDQTIIVRDGVVTALGPSAATPVPADATVIDRGRPLRHAGAHRHARAPVERRSRRVRQRGHRHRANMWGFASIATMQRDIEAGARVGPTIISASPGLDGPPAQWPGTLLITDAREARALVRAQADAGWPYLKVYTRLTPEVFDSVMVAARSFGITPIGHVPFEVDVLHAMAAGMRSIEHFTGYDRVVSRTRRAGTWGWADADPSRFASLVEATVRAGCGTARRSRSSTSSRSSIRRLSERRSFEIAAVRARGSTCGRSYPPRYRRRNRCRSAGRVGARRATRDGRGGPNAIRRLARGYDECRGVPRPT